MSKAQEEAIAVHDDEEEKETRSSSTEADNDTTNLKASAVAIIISPDHHWEVVRTELRAIISELALLEEYFMKAASSADMRNLTSNETHKLFELYKELNKLAHVFKVGYHCPKLVQQKHFENYLKTFKDEFSFVLRKIAPSSGMPLDNPKLFFKQMTLTLSAIENVKNVLITNFSNQLYWRDIFELLAVLILYACDVLSDCFAAHVHFEFLLHSGADERFWWYTLLNCILTLSFVHVAAFCTACKFVSNRFLIPVYTVFPVLPIQIVLRLLQTSVKFKTKPDSIRFDELIRYHTTREDLIFIYSSQVLLEAFPQLMLQGCVILNVLFLNFDFDSYIPTERLALTWITSFVNVCYTCSKSFSFELMNSSRLITAFYFVFFVFYEFSRCVSLMLLFVAAPWWLILAGCAVRFQTSLFWLYSRISSRYNIPFSFYRKIVSCFNGSVMLTCIPMLYHWCDFPQFWMNALDVFACLTIPVACAFSAFSQVYIRSVVLVVTIILAWFGACITAWNVPSLKNIFFGSPSEANGYPTQIPAN